MLLMQVAALEQELTDARQLSESAASEIAAAQHAHTVALETIK
jgi:hypothetical protein